jgi:hypothetical protein
MQCNDSYVLDVLDLTVHFGMGCHIPLNVRRRAI